MINENNINKFNDNSVIIKCKKICDDASFFK